MARYVVGIDLGTSNCCVAYVDSEGDNQMDILPLTQVVGSGVVEERATLASCALAASASEVPRAAIALPWDSQTEIVVGAWARERGAELPHRLISSAKSWLSYTGVDRTAPLLPWHPQGETVPEGGRRMSPVEVSSLYLQHIRNVWNARMSVPLEEQEVFLTVPASFDAVARELTVVAAKQAGLTQVTLLEEPQAAFYAWLDQSGDDWRKHLAAGDSVLVCDVGGGTTDFSLIAVTDDGAGNLALERVAVGEHILLGGDNMDLALAYRVIASLPPKKQQLKPMQRRALVAACQRAKEAMFADLSVKKVPISVLGSGSKLIGGTLRTQLTREDLEAVVLSGFVPECSREAVPKSTQCGGTEGAGVALCGRPGFNPSFGGFFETRWIQTDSDSVERWV